MVIDSHLNLNFDTSEVREISLQSLGVDGRGTFGRGTPSEDLHSDGITWVALKE